MRPALFDFLGNAPTVDIPSSLLEARRAINLSEMMCLRHSDCIENALSLPLVYFEFFYVRLRS
jgi:hypothetical protein